jgi:hypothetical protein
MNKFAYKNLIASRFQEIARGADDTFVLCGYEPASKKKQKFEVHGWYDSSYLHAEVFYNTKTSSVSSVRILMGAGDR